MDPARSNRWQPPALDTATMWPQRNERIEPAAFRAALAASAPRRKVSPPLAPRRRVGLPARDSGPSTLAQRLPGMVEAMGELLELVGKPEVYSADAPLARGRTLIELHETDSGSMLYLHYGCRPDDDRELVERASHALERLLNLAGIRTSLRSVQVNPVLRGAIPRGLAVALRLHGPSAARGQ